MRSMATCWVRYSKSKVRVQKHPREVVKNRNSIPNTSQCIISILWLFSKIVRMLNYMIGAPIDYWVISWCLSQPLNIQNPKSITTNFLFPVQTVVHLVISIMRYSRHHRCVLLRRTSASFIHHQQRWWVAVPSKGMLSRQPCGHISVVRWWWRAATGILTMLLVGQLNLLWLCFVEGI